MARLPTIAAFSAAALALAAVPAHAAPVTVVGASPDSMLTVEDIEERGFDRLDINLIGPAAVGGEDFTTGESGDPPLWPDEGLLADTELPSSDGTTRILSGGVLNAAAAAVELTFDNGRTVRYPTVEGSAYQGRQADRVRFFLGETTLPEADVDDDAAGMRMLDASGAVIGVAKDRDIEHSIPLMRRSAGGALIRMTATVISRLSPLPGAPEHRAEELCLRTGVNEAARGWDVACQDPEEEPMSLGGWRGCGRVPSTLAGFLPADASTLSVRLGSGRTLRLPTLAAPFGRTGRIVIDVQPRGEAVRSAAALDAAGRRLAATSVELAPPDRRCDEDLKTDDLGGWEASSDGPDPRPGLPPGTEVAGTAAGRQLLVRDSGEDLCIGIDQLDLDGSDCSRPPTNSRFDYLLVDKDRGVLAGMFAAPVSFVDLQFRGGGTARIPASPGSAYTGRYRDALRFAFAPLPAGKTIVGAALRDPTGHTIGRALPETLDDDDSLIRPPRTLLSEGGARAVVSAERSEFSSRLFACVGLELGDEQSDCDDGFDFGYNTVSAVVPCQSPRTILVGIARPTVSRVDIRLADGRTMHPQMARFPSGLGSRAKVFLAVLPRRLEVTRVHFSRRHEQGRSDTLALPTRAPARQCGYRTFDVLS
jgi:hypothetical protein